jgi:hypothetical protein
MNLWNHPYPKIATEKFEGFLPGNLKSGPSNKIKALSYDIIIYRDLYGLFTVLDYKKVPLFCWFDHFLDFRAEILSLANQKNRTDWCAPERGPNNWTCKL